MPPTLQEVAEQARALSDGDKNRLIEDLLVQLIPPDPAIEAVWADEVAHRFRAHKEGRSKSYSYEEVMARYDNT